MSRFSGWLVVFAALLATACSGGADTPDAAQTGTASGQETTEAAGEDPGAAEEVPATETADDGTVEETDVTNEPAKSGGTEIATFGAGCFWCVEAVLEQLDGVRDVSSGYMGGDVENPTYEAICTGTTGHAEVVQVTFDQTVISFDDLLGWFWRLHDPTTLNRQGADVGTQYRSAIFVHSPEQRAAAEAAKKSAQANFGDPIVTEITDASTYYEAETGHQDYYRLNKEQGYCRVVIAPKLRKLKLED